MWHSVCQFPTASYHPIFTVSVSYRSILYLRLSVATTTNGCLNFAPSEIWFLPGNGASSNVVLTWAVDGGLVRRVAAEAPVGDVAVAAAAAFDAADRRRGLRPIGGRSRGRRRRRGCGGHRRGRIRLLLRGARCVWATVSVSVPSCIPR